ncbi:MAG TPA: diaminopimelate decarboxylase [Acidimicrobiales bacterium]|nr:diaminopimelate decarboxylase [Acidimicrobiales bacterium]
MSIADPGPAEPAAAASEEPVGLHLLPDSAEIGPDGHLRIGGVDVVELAAEHGTPLFVYDEEHLRARCREAVAAFGTGVAYGSKAFLCKAMARLARDEGMILDVATGEEMSVALAGGVSPSGLVLHGNNKSQAEVDAALSLGVHRIVVDSSHELDRIAFALSELGPMLAAQRGGRPVQLAALLRVTPGVEAHTHEFVATGREDTKFGFSLASGAADAAVEAARSIEGLELVGAHAHVGSQIFRLEAFEQAVAVLVPFVKRHGLSELCVGGGLGVAYLDGERATTISAWAEVVRHACDAAGLPESVRVTAEPGRAITAGAAITCYRVGTVKRLPGIRNYVAVDGGMSDNPRPVLYGSGYEAFLPRAAGAARPLAARVVGKHCESGDVLVADARLPADLDVGDVLATPVTGAYGYSMASNYNRLGRPEVVFVSGGEARVVIRRERIEDLLRLEP